MSIEKALEKRLRETVKKRGGLAIKIWCLSFTGFPDRIVLMPGARIFFVELKDTGKELSPVQAVVHAQLIKFGFDTRLIDTNEKLNDLFREI